MDFQNFLRPANDVADTLAEEMLGSVASPVGPISQLGLVLFLSRGGFDGYYTRIPCFMFSLSLSLSLSYWASVS